MAMRETVIRPSMRRVKWGLAVAVTLFFGLLYVYLRYREDLAWWILLVGVLPFASPLLAWLDSNRVRLVVDGGILKHESGLLRKSRRLAAASDVVGVSVERSFGQRLWGTGTVVVETKGPQGRFAVPDVDRPNRIAEMIRSAGISPTAPPVQKNERDTQAS